MATAVWASTSGLNAFLKFSVSTFKSAHAYQTVWMKEGAPLKVLTENFRNALRPLVDAHTAVAMRYGNPTPEAALRELEKQSSDIREIFIAPLYPHYAMSS